MSAMLASFHKETARPPRPAVQQPAAGAPPLIDERLRLLLDEGEEIFATDLERMIDPTIEMTVAMEGKVSLENDSIMATEHGYNLSSEFRSEVRRHGVLLFRRWYS